MGVSLPFRLILASSSPDRRKLLQAAGLEAEVRPSHIDEPTDAADGDIRHYVAELAWRKAAAVAPQVESGVIVAADTVGWFDGHVMGKPTDAEDARRILRALSGRVHELWTGVCLWRRPEDVQLAWQERALLEMKPLSEAELEAHIAGNEWVGRSGAYAIRETGDPFLSLIEGTVSNVIGLPMESLLRVLVPFGTMPLLEKGL